MWGKQSDAQHAHAQQARVSALEGTIFFDEIYSVPMKTTFLKPLSGLFLCSGQWHDQLGLKFTWKEDAREERIFYE